MALPFLILHSQWFFTFQMIMVCCLMQLSHPTCSYVHTVTEWWPILIRLAVLLLLNTAWDLQTDADKRHWKIARLEQHCTPQAKPMSKGGEKVGQRREVQGVCMWVGDQARYMQGRGLERWEVGVRVFFFCLLFIYLHELQLQVSAIWEVSRMCQK